MSHVFEQAVLLFSAPFYTAIILLEMALSYWGQRHWYSWRDTLTNLYLMSLNMGLDVVCRLCFTLPLLHWAYRHHVVEWRTIWLYWLMLFVAEDFVFYWLHRVDHHCRLFWAAHVTHHSSERFNLTTGFRSSVFQPLYRFLYFMPLAWLGFQPLDILLMYAITQIYGIIVHTRAVGKLGFLEYILVTPSHHRVHHASNVLYLDKNMGMVLICWDMLFGTFQPEEPTEPVRYGLHKPLTRHDPGYIVLHEWQAIARDLRRKDLSWQQRLGYLFNPPGWSHDGSTLTARQLRQQQILGCTAEGATVVAPPT